MAKLFLIRGLPGSGKSTLANKMLEDRKVSAHWEADMFFYNGAGEYLFDPSLLPAAHAWCKSMVRESLLDGKSVAVSNTFVKEWEAAPYFDMAADLGAEVEIITMNGNYGSIHNVPEDAIERMRQNWEEFSC